MHSHMRELTYSVVRNFQQKLLSDRPRFGPLLTRTYCDNKGGKSLSTIEQQQLPSEYQPPSHLVKRREAKRQREESLKLAKEIIAENDR